MSHDFGWGAGEVFPLRGGRRAVRLEARGLRHPEGRLPSSVAELTPYEDITHLSTSLRGLRVGARRSVYTFPRRRFADPRAPELLMQAIVERIRGLEGGAERLVHITQVEVFGHGPRRLRAVSAVIAACFLLFLLQLTPWSAEIVLAGVFSKTLLQVGELWRLVTANLLHAGPFHLTLNVMGLAAIGALVEWPLGSARAFTILVACGIASMFASYAGGYENALGASGMVMGAAGAALYLELFCPDWLPVGWRIPRRFFLGMLGVQVLLEVAAALYFPVFASYAHAGGFAAGFAMAALLVRQDVRVVPAPGLVRGACFGLAGVALLGIGYGVRDFAGDPDWFEGRARRLLDLEDASPVVLNDTAWRIVTDETGADPEQVDLALALARRAVDETERSDPNVLDTLAEVHFAAGDVEAALAAIDEAIALAPAVPYFQAQRRRFLGEGDPDSRPEPPTTPPWLAPPEPPEPSYPDSESVIEV